MAVAPQKLREATFQMLYSYDMSNATDEGIVELLSAELALPKSTMKTVQQKVRNIQSHLNEIDALISETSHSYDFERIQKVEKNILRLGIYELIYDPSVPQKVVFAECMRLATKFSTKEAASFINAILDAILKKREGIHVSPDDIAHHSTKMDESEREINDVIKNLPKKKGDDDLHE